MSSRRRSLVIYARSFSHILRFLSIIKIARELLCAHKMKSCDTCRKKKHKCRAIMARVCKHVRAHLLITPITFELIYLFSHGTNIAYAYAFVHLTARRFVLEKVCCSLLFKSSFFTRRAVNSWKFFQFSFSHSSTHKIFSSLI